MAAPNRSGFWRRKPKQGGIKVKKRGCLKSLPFKRGIGEHLLPSLGDWGGLIREDGGRIPTCPKSQVILREVEGIP
jgi:hypothetical protein